MPRPAALPRYERDFEAPGRSMALGTECMAATSHPLGTLTALEILRAGGNAIDAAVAAAAVLGVVEPTQTGIGGDCFALYMPGGKGRIHAINGSGWAAKAASGERLRAEGLTTIAPTSPHAVTVPGAVATWARLVAEHGRLGLAELLAPAIRVAADGYPVSERLARDWRRQVAKLAANDTAAALFLLDGAAPLAGERHRQTRLAAALRTIAAGGADAFYRGPITEDLVATITGAGGLLTHEDFAEFVPEFVEPITATYRGHQLWECPPNGQGLTPLLIAQILEHFDLSALGPLSAERLHLIAEASRVGYAARDALLGDPRAAPVPLAALFDAANVQRLAGLIRRDARLPNLPPPLGPHHRDTVYLTVVDRDRNVVSFINSIFDDFGSGLVTPEYGIVLHNRGSGFVLERGHPNELAGRKRPLHTIIPAILTRDSRAVLAFGVTGGQFQPAGQIELLSNVLDHDLPLQAAIDLPRIFARGDSFEVEARIPGATLAALGALGHRISRAENPLGTAQAIRIDWERGVLHGGADARRDGLALGW